jgi:hypothetical protein
VEKKNGNRVGYSCDLEGMVHQPFRGRQSEDVLYAARNCPPEFALSAFISGAIMAGIPFRLFTGSGADAGIVYYAKARYAGGLVCFCIQPGTGCIRVKDCQDFFY